MKNMETFSVNNTLNIPENIPLRWELFRGFGLLELLRSAIVMAVVLAGVVLYCTFSDSPVKMLTSVAVVLFFGVGCGGLFAKQSFGLSMYEYMKYAVQFGRTQKQYDNVREELVYAEE